MTPLLRRGTMTRLVSILATSVACLGLAIAAGRAQDDKKIVQNVTAERIEAILKDLGIEFKKSAGKTEGVQFYDFERNNYKIRLHNYQGKDLWIDAFFSDAMSAEEVNQWNSRAKFSRAVQLKGEKQAVSLEAQLDCMGGVNDLIVRQFVRRFDGEVLQFVKFLAK
jgi:hypothetical protein